MPKTKTDPGALAPSSAPRRALAAALMAATALASPALAQTSGRAFDLPSEPLAQALKDFGRAADQQLIFSPDLVRGLRSHPVQGRLSPDAALDALLQDTGLAWRRAPAGGILIERRTGARPPGAGAAAAAEPPTALEELVVTGTHIEGAAPVGARPVVLDQAAILRLGRSNASDLLKAIPQNVGLGTGEEARGGTQPSQNSLNFANSPNLRGLGTDATLTLIDGIRAPPTTYGGLVDVSQIPLIALSRVEVLADGASAVYGSDAVGGVVNFVLKHDVEGGEARIRAGVADGLDDEIADLAQGRVWSSGSVYAALEYEHRSRLAADARPALFTDDLRAVGGPDLRRPNASPGNISALGTTFALAGGGRDAVPGPLTAGTKNLDNRWAQADVLPSISRLSGAITLRQELAPWATAFFDGLGQSRESVKRDAPLASTLAVPRSNPFFVSPVPGASTVNVLYSSIGDFGPVSPRARVEDLLFTGGLKLKLPRAWRATLQGTCAHDRTLYYYDSFPNTALLAKALANPDPALAFDPFGGPGANPASIVEAVKGYISDRSHVGYSALDADASGPLASLPGGELRAAIGVESRREHLVTSNASFASRLAPTLSGINDAREVRGAYAELNVPIVGPENARPGLAALTVSASVRTEDYSDSGRTTNPRYGLEWSPVADLKVSATWGTSFKAPTLFQKDTSTNSIFVSEFPVAAAPGGFETVILLSGKATGLKAETAETWTLGADWRPARWSGLELGVHYFSVRYRDRIQFGDTGQIAAALASGKPGPLVPLVAPTAAQVAAYYADPLFSPTSSRPAADEIAAVVDFRQNNLGSVEQTGLDYSAAYGWQTSIGRLQVLAEAVQVTRYAVALAPGQPVTDLLNTNANPVGWRGFATLAWSRGPWDGALRANYVGAYRNTEVAPSQKVSKWVTLDLHAAYAPSEGFLGRAGVRLALDVQNLFDRDPPRMANVLGAIAYDPEEASALGRMTSITLSKTW